MAIIMASQVVIVEMAPVMARPPVEKIAPMRGVSKVVPQVGQPAPRAMSPVMIPAFSMFSEFLEALLLSRFLSQRRTIIPIKIPCKIEIAKMGSQSRKGWLMPKIAINELPRILKDLASPALHFSLTAAI